MLRLFIAVDLPAELRDSVVEMMDGVHDAKWVNAKQLHITLRFLGNTAEAALPDLGDRLASLRHEAFRLRLRGAGVFPEARAGKRAKPPRVLWLGLEPTAAIERLKNAVDAAIAGAGADRGQQARHDHDHDHDRGGKTEKPTFSPHLTLARFSALPDHTLSDFLAKWGDYASAGWWVTNLHLYQSTLRTHGAIHTRLASYPLAQTGSAE